MKRFVLISLVFFLVGQIKAKVPEGTFLWKSPSAEGIPYRIPAIAVTNDGTLIALTDYRYCKQDIGMGEIDILGRISSDNGKTWEESRVICNGTGQGDFGCGYGDAAIVADRKSQEVLMMCVSGHQLYTKATPESHNCVTACRSMDGGKTWQIEDVSHYFYSQVFPEAYSMFFSSGRILQSSKCKVGKYYRLYAAMPVNGSTELYGGWRGCFAVYSDDFGRTWNILGGKVTSINQSPAPECDESKLEELPNGDILLSGRGPAQNGRYYNVFHYQNFKKDKTIGQWGNVCVTTAESGMTEISECNGEILMVKGYDAAGHKVKCLLQSVSKNKKREKVSIYYKILDESREYNPQYFTKGWKLGLQLTDKESAYSTMILQHDGRIGFYYEYGQWRDGGYDMLYVPLTLEQATAGAVSSAKKKKVLDGFDLEIGF